MTQLDEISGVGLTGAHVILAEIGLDMSRFPTDAHLCSWARFAPGVKESAGRRKGRGSTGHGNPYLARMLGEAAVCAGRTDIFLGERYRRIARRRGKKRNHIRQLEALDYEVTLEPAALPETLGPGSAAPRRQAGGPVRPSPTSFSDLAVSMAGQLRRHRG